MLESSWVGYTVAVALALLFDVLVAGTIGVLTGIIWAKVEKRIEMEGGGE